MAKKKKSRSITGFSHLGEPLHGPSSVPAATPYRSDLRGLYSWLWEGADIKTLSEHIGAAERCEQLACQQLASLPVRLNPHTARWRSWLGNPDPAHLNGLFEAVWQIAWCLYRHGEAFLWATNRYADAYPATWQVLDPVAVEVDLIEGAFVFSSNGYRLERDDVLWIRRNPRLMARGTGVLQSYWSAMLSAWASERHAAAVLDNSGVPAAVLRYAGRLNANRAKELQEEWVKATRSRMGAPAILSEGLDYQALSWSPKDLMLLELREYDAKQIAAAYGVPAFLLNLAQAGGLNYSNPASLFGIWWQAELMPMGRRIEAALSTWLPTGQSIEFNPAVLLRPDFEHLVSSWLQMLQAGAITEDEFREAVLDLPPKGAAPIDMLDEGEAGQQNTSALVQTFPDSEGTESEAIL